MITPNFILRIGFLCSMAFISSCRMINRLKTAQPLEKGKTQLITGIGFQQLLTRNSNPDQLDEEISNSLVPVLLLGLRYGFTEKYSLGVGLQTPTTLFIDQKYSLALLNERHFISIAPLISFSQFVYDSLGIKQVWSLYHVNLPILYTYEWNQNIHITSSLGFSIRRDKVDAKNSQSNSDNRTTKGFDLQINAKYKKIFSEIAMTYPIREEHVVFSYMFGYEISL